MALMNHLLDLSQWPADRLPQRATVMAQLSLLDWLACGVAGKSEPIAQKMGQLAALDGGTEIATMFDGHQAPARMAAMVNGATSHALDFDDTHFAHVGHLSVSIFPAALAVGQAENAPLGKVTSAFLVGAECAIRIGLHLGSVHYNAGFHQTATAGAFGATVAAGRLMGLDRTQMRHAISLCSTRASGLKSQFGTMGKPWNAGFAAANGVECAALARLGVESCHDGLDGDQGFVASHQGMESEELPVLDRFLFEDNLYKFHACCHGTHAMIEGLRQLCCGLSDVTKIDLRTNPRWLSVCDKKVPTTGLEMKFSYAWLAGMTLRGDNLAQTESFADAVTHDATLANFAKCVGVVGDASLTDLQCAGHVTLKDDRTLPFSHDLAAAVPSDILRTKLQAKAVGLLGDQGAQIWGLWNALETMQPCDLWNAVTG